MAVTGPDFLLFPFFKHLFINLGIFYIPFAVLVLTATSNAVNLTDGLDGLAAGVTISATICFAVVAYLAGRVDGCGAYLIIPHVTGAGELTVLLCAADRRLLRLPLVQQPSCPNLHGRHRLHDARRAARLLSHCSSSRNSC
jgi:hypothetical protein